MKKYFLMAIMAVAAVTASAQVYVGGSLGFSSVKPDGGKSQTAFNINPEVGYSLSDNLAVGAVLGFDYAKDAYTAFEVSPYVRYKAIQWDKVNIFLDGAVGITSYKPDGGSSATAWNVGIKPGIEFKATDKISLVAHMGFLGYEDNHKVDGTKSFGVNLHNDITFGVYYNF